MSVPAALDFNALCRGYAQFLHLLAGQRQSLDEFPYCLHVDIHSDEKDVVVVGVFDPDQAFLRGLTGFQEGLAVGIGDDMVI